MIRTVLGACSLYGAVGAATVAAALSGYILAAVVTQLRPSQADRMDRAPAGGGRVAVAAGTAETLHKSKREQIVDSPVAGGQSLRLMLSVIVGPSRAEVYVNTRRLGETPYLGDYSCREGEALRFEIVPRRGPLIERTAVCQGQSLRIRD